MPDVTPQSPPTLSDGDFERIRQLAYNRFGVDLREKKDLVWARLRGVVRSAGCRTFSAYYDYVARDRSGEALEQMIDALTTNHTSFLREPAHFEFLTQVARREFTDASPLRIWSAACASGEEPYSIAMTMLAAGIAPERFSILATDISNRALDKGRRGTYSVDRLRELPPHWSRAFFCRPSKTAVVNPAPPVLQVRPQVARHIEFRRINLLELLPPLSAFQIVFCRNAMIYFDRQTQTRVIANLTQVLEPGGYLLVGHSETLSGIVHGLAYVRPAVYRKPSDVRKGAA